MVGVETLQGFVRRAPIAVSLFDTDTRYLALSGTWLTFCGIEAGGAIGRSHTELFPGSDNAWAEACTRCLAGEPGVIGEYPFTGTDGRTRWLRIAFERWMNPDGTVGGVACFADDRTEQKHAADRLRASEDRFRILTSAAFDIFYEMGPDWGEVRLLQGRELLLDRPEPDSEWLARYILPEDRRLVTEAIADAVRDGAVFELEHRVIRADGSVGWIHSRAIPERNSDGVVIGWIGAAIDVTPYREAHAALKEREERLQSVLDGVPSSIITADEHGVITSVNNATVEMFGYAVSELIGQNVSLLMPEPYRHEHADHVERYLKTGEPHIIGISREVAARRKDGSVFPVDLIVTEVDSLRTFVSVITDTTMRNESNERLRQSERLSAIGTLAAGIGHDIHNILLPVRARLDVIENAELDASTRLHLEEARKALVHLQGLADDLNHHIVQPGDTDVGQRGLDLDDWWGSAGLLLRNAAEGRVRLVASIEPGLPRIPIQPHRLTQAALNLVSNAANAVGENGLVEIRAWMGEDQRVRLSVMDNGPGMTPEVRRRALEPFFTTKKRGLGTGLGLWLVQVDVEAGGGTVELESEPGRGTKVTLVFPPTAAPAEVEREPGQTCCRAVVGVGDERLRSVIVGVLEAMGCGVDTAHGAPIEGADFWVTDLRGESLRSGLARAPGTPALVLAPEEPVPIGERCVFLGEQPGFDAIRAAIENILSRGTP